MQSPNIWWIWCLRTSSFRKGRGAHLFFVTSSGLPDDRSRACVFVGLFHASACSETLASVNGPSREALAEGQFAHKLRHDHISQPPVRTARFSKSVTAGAQQFFAKPNVCACLALRCWLLCTKKPPSACVFSLEVRSKNSGWLKEFANVRMAPCVDSDSGIRMFLRLKQKRVQ